MHVEGMTFSNNWAEVKDLALRTIGKENTAGTEPSGDWQRRMLRAEHSPIRVLTFKWTWVDLPYFVSVHIVRHKIGVEHFCKSQRSDRTGIPRDQLPQGALVTHTCVANAQALINISRKRLCIQASPETREAWEAVVDQLPRVIKDACVPDCVYRGYCGEYKSCGWHKTEVYRQTLENYRRGISDGV